MAINPRKRFGIAFADDYTIFELGGKTIINPADFVSMGKATPFEGYEVHARCMKTVCNSNTAFSEEANE